MVARTRNDAKVERTGACVGREAGEGTRKTDQVFFLSSRWMLTDGGIREFKISGRDTGRSKVPTHILRQGNADRAKF